MVLDLATVKERQQQTWDTGDYARVGNTLVLMGELLCEAADLRGGQRVLDVATGSGNTALSAARRGCRVTGIDYVPALIAQAQARAAAEGLAIDFTIGDAEDLEAPDASFDTVLSTVGVMFTADQERAARELLRVCRPGGKIGLANWTPDGFIGQMFRVVGRYAPPPAGVRSPLQWGTEERLRELFGAEIVALEITRREFVFRFPTARHFVEHFRAYYGPLHRAFAAQDADQQAAFTADLIALLEEWNTADDGTLVVPSAYLEVVATRR
jgi:ubiquinone/menaquinone biosynthesis C-methylase UbiE